MSTRSYDSSSRREAADQARSRVLAVTRERFTTLGYAATTVPDIARAAGVSPQSVYANHGGKADLLKRLVDIDIVGDEEERPVSEREIVDDIRRARSGSARCRLFAQFVSEVHQRTGPMVGVCTAAAGNDAEIAELLQKMERQRRAGMREFVDLMGDLGSLRDDDEAARDRYSDIVWTLASSAAYTGLVGVRGWTNQDYVDWLADTLVTTLGAGRR